MNRSGEKKENQKVFVCTCLLSVLCLWAHPETLLGSNGAGVRKLLKTEVFRSFLYSIRICKAALTL
jgi:hypothetical protein